MIDSHCHLADDEFQADVEAVVGRAQAEGLTACLCVLDATRAVEHARAIALLKKWPALWFSFGVHPHRAGEVDPSNLPVPEVVAVPRIVALGEIGLDYHYDFAPRPVQQAVFRGQLAHALAHDWPVIIHCREADDDVLAAIREVGKGALRGVFHCFTGDVAFARRVIEAGFYLSFSGIVTFPKAAALREAARYCPIDRLLVETDSPYLAPVPLRGSRNEPAHVKYVVSRLADERGLSTVELASAVDANFARLFDRSVTWGASR